MKWRFLWACAAAVALWAAPARAQSAPATSPATAPASPDDEQALWRKVWAFRAAQAEAAGGLARQIRLLPLAGGAKVGEFLAEDARLERALVAFLLGIEPAETAQHTPDGLCRVRLSLPAKDLAATLATLRQRVYTGEKFKDADFAAAAGGWAGPLDQAAAGRADPALAVEALLPRRPDRPAFQRAAPAARKFWQRHVTEAGRALAEKDARADALRRLTDRVGDVRLDDATRLAAYVASPGGEKPDLRQFLLAARQQGLRYHTDAPIVEAEVEVPLRTVYACLKAWAHAHRPADEAGLRRLERLIVSARGAAIRQVGLGTPPAEQLKNPDKKLRRLLALAAAAPEWLSRSLRETGRAEIKPPADRPRAPAGFRAAAWGARAALAERLAALPAGEGTTVGQLAGRDEKATAALRSVLLAARHAAEPRLADDHTAEVVLELPLTPLWRLVLHWQR